VNFLGNDGLGPLHLAASTNCWYMLPELIQRGADLVFEDEMGDTALHKACRVGDNVSAAILLRAGARFDVCGKLALGVTPMHVASLYGRDLILSLFYNYDSLVYCCTLFLQDALGSTPLDLAATSQLKESMEKNYQYSLRKIKAFEESPEGERAKADKHAVKCSLECPLCISSATLKKTNNSNSGVDAEKATTVTKAVVEDNAVDAKDFWENFVLPRIIHEKPRLTKTSSILSRFFLNGERFRAIEGVQKIL
jgi:hypothetical protein